MMLTLIWDAFAIIGLVGVLLSAIIVTVVIMIGITE